MKNKKMTSWRFFVKNYLAISILFLAFGVIMMLNKTESLFWLGSLMWVIGGFIIPTASYVSWKSKDFE